MNRSDGNGLKPTLAELVALRATAQRRPPARKGRHNVTGPAQSNQRGRGMEYAESREYVAGDDVRHIDWRLTARSGRTHTKLFQAERERLTLVVADTSPALYFGTRVRFKSVQAARAAAVAVWAAVRDGDRVAILRGSSQEAPVPPASGARGALRVLDALVRWYSQAPADDAGLSVALDNAARLLRPGSRLIVLADPRSLASIAESRWPALAVHHEVTVLLLTDALESEPPKATLPFSSGSHRLELDLGDAGQRKRWQDEFNHPVERALETLPRRGVRVYSLQGDAPSESWLPLLGRAIAGGVMQAQELVLRDVHVPPAPPLWPPAPGWWLLAIAVLLLLATACAIGLWRRRRRQAWLKLFNEACAQVSPPARIAAISELLRRAARRVDKQADRLQGEDWLRLLDGKKGNDFSAGPGRLLLEGGYLREVEVSAWEAVRDLARTRFLQLMAKRK